MKIICAYILCNNNIVVIYLHTVTSIFFNYVIIFLYSLNISKYFFFIFAVDFVFKTSKEKMPFSLIYNYLGLEINTTYKRVIDFNIPPAM